MAETMTASVKLGQKVPDFEMVTYEPTKGDFGKFSMRTRSPASAGRSSFSTRRISRSQLLLALLPREGTNCVSVLTVTMSRPSSGTGHAALPEAANRSLRRR